MKNLKDVQIPWVREFGEELEVEWPEKVHGVMSINILKLVNNRDYQQSEV